MVQLSREDKIKVVGWVSSLPEFATEKERRRLMSLAGFDILMNQLDLSGSPFIAAVSAVDYLCAYGRLNSESSETLGLLLNLVSTIVGAELQADIAVLIQKYQLDIPIVASPSNDFVDPGLSGRFLEEKIIGQNTLRPVSFLFSGYEASKSIALVSVCVNGKKWHGSGFLVAPCLLLTNNHVISSNLEAENSTITFNYELDDEGRPREVESFGVNRLVETNKNLDFTVLEIDGVPGNKYGWLRPSNKIIGVGDRVNIIQHPGGQHKQLSIQNNFIEYVDDSVVQYLNSTLPGSSGPPVLDDDWKVVAIHHSGGNIKEPETGNIHYRNEGVLLSKISSAISFDLFRN